MDLRTALLALLLLPGAPCATALAAETTQPPLMLATPFRADVPVTAYLVSEKLDGVRARWDGQQLRTRGGITIEAPAWFTAGWPAQPLDGELWIGRGRFQEVSGLVRALQPDEAAWRRVRYMAFDLPDDPAAFVRRADRLRALLAEVGVPWLRAIPQSRVANRGQLDARLQSVVAAGGEGLMLHRADARYRFGRSDDLRKLKPWDDAEARVVGYRPGSGKYAGMVGALVVEDASGRRFGLGSGLSDADRAQPPPPGTMVTYRFNGRTAKGTPRFARYLRVRED